MTTVTGKIKKLLALAKDQDGTAEAESAMLKAQELLLKNDLTMDFITSFTEEEKEVKEEYIDDDGKKKMSNWKKRLASVIGNNFRTTVLIHSGGSTYLTIIGLKQDVEITKQMIQFAWNIASREVEIYFSKHKKENASQYNNCKMMNSHKKYTRRIKEDFYSGFITGVRKKFEKQVTEKSLVLVKDALVVQKLKSMNIGKVNCSSTSMGNANAQHAGYQAGKNMQKDVYIK